MEGGASWKGEPARGGERRRMSRAWAKSVRRAVVGTGEAEWVGMMAGARVLPGSWGGGFK